jgi:hypothetical protein
VVAAETLLAGIRGPDETRSPEATIMVNIVKMIITRMKNTGLRDDEVENRRFMTYSLGENVTVQLNVTGSNRILMTDRPGTIHYVLIQPESGGEKLYFLLLVPCASG